MSVTATAAASRSMHGLAWQVSPSRRLELDQPRLMGILNLTPDSFSDGGRYGSPQAAVDAALQMRDDGAAIIDIGGESTRPGAAAIDASEQLQRVLPVIQSLRTQAGSTALLISIDTTRPDVAAAALDAGADIINDVSAGTDEPGETMLRLAAQRRCGLVLMHRLTAPASDHYSHQYAASPDYGGDVTAAVSAYLQRRIDAAIACGVDFDSIVIDPGLGFGKSIAQNHRLIASFDLMQQSLGRPMLSAASRKSFVGKLARIDDPAQRDAASTAITTAHVLQGVRLFRVHAVALHRQAMAVAMAIAQAGDLQA